MYPLLSKLPQAPATLSPHLRTILLATGHVAAGDASAVVAAFSHLPSDHHAKAYELALVQTAPLVGVPRVLHSAAALQTAGIIMGSSSTSPSLSSSLSNNQITSSQQLENGQAVFDVVYGRNAQRVRQRLQTMHPMIQHWVLQHVYGALLARTGQSVANVTLRERELAVVAALCTDPVANVQLASHLRGAINAGASREEVAAVVEHTHVIRAEAAEAAQATWATLDRSRYAL